MFKLFFSFLLASSLSLGFSAEKVVHTYKAEMSCEACANNIKKGLTSIKKKVKSYNFDLKKQTVSIVFEGENKPLSEKELKELQKKSGYILSSLKK